MLSMNIIALLYFVNLADNVLKCEPLILLQTFNDLPLPAFSVRDVTTDVFQRTLKVQ